MVKYSDRLDRAFRALADASRRAMVERLARRPASVSELARPFEMSMPAVLQHLSVLEAAGIVTSQKAGRVRTYQLAADALTECGEWIGHQRLPAERKLDRLGEFLGAQHDAKKLTTEQSDAKKPDTQKPDTQKPDTANEET